MSKSDETYKSRLGAAEGTGDKHISRVDNTPLNRELASKILDAMLSEKSTRAESDFGERGVKEQGFSKGGVAERADNHKRYMLKEFRTTQPTGEREQIDRGDAITEYLTSKVYERILFDRAPKINLAKGAPKDKAFLSSKFFEDFQTLSNFTASDDTQVDQDASQLKKVEGLAKVAAACLFCGEMDYHGSNLGVVPQKDADGKIINGPDGEPEKYTLVKIDHGKSNVEKFENESDMRASLDTRINGASEGYGYSNMKLNLSEFREALEEIAKIKDTEIEHIIDKGVYNLKQAGVDLTDGITRLDKRSEAIEVSGSGIGSDFIDGFKERRDQIAELSKTIAFVEKIEVPESEQENWKNGGWLRSIQGNDPLASAILSEYKIEGKHALEWAIENDKKINGQDPIEYLGGQEAYVGETPITEWAYKYNLKQTDPARQIKFDGVDPGDLIDPSRKTEINEVHREEQAARERKKSRKEERAPEVKAAATESSKSGHAVVSDDKMREDSARKESSTGRLSPRAEDARLSTSRVDVKRIRRLFDTQKQPAATIYSGKQGSREQHSR